MPLLNQPRKRTKKLQRHPMQKPKPALTSMHREYKRIHTHRRTKNLIQQLPPEREELVTENHLLARKIAHDMVNKHNLTAAGEQYDDIESEAFVGLVKAAMRYDPEFRAPHGGYVKFSSFAVVYIRGEILHYLRDRTYLLKISHATKELWQKGKDKHWAGVPAIEIAESLGATLEQWLLAVASCSGPPMPIMEHAKLVDPPEVHETHIRPYIDAAMQKLGKQPITVRRAILNDLSGKTIHKLSDITRTYLSS